MESTFGTVIEETAISMDISQHDIVQFTNNYVHRPNATLPTTGLAYTVDDPVDFDLSGVPEVSTEAAQKGRRN